MAHPPILGGDLNYPLPPPLNSPRLLAKEQHQIASLAKLCALKTSSPLFMQITFRSPSVGRLICRPPPAKHCTKTNLCRRKPKRQATPNEHWLHLSSGKADLLFALQVTLATISTHITSLMHLLMLILAVETMVDADNLYIDIIDVVVNSIVFVLMSFLGLLRAVRVADGVLFDIPPEEEDAPLQFTCAKGLRIDDLSNTATLKLTCFNWCQLHRPYAALDLEGQLDPMQDTHAARLGRQRLLCSRTA